MSNPVRIESLVQAALSIKYPDSRAETKPMYRPLFRFMQSAATADPKSATPAVRVLPKLTQEEPLFWVVAYQRGKDKLTEWTFVDKRSQKLYLIPKDTPPEVWKKDFQAFLQGLPTEMNWFKHEFYVLKIRAKEIPMLSVIGRQVSLSRETRYEALPGYIEELIRELERLDIRPDGNPLLAQRWASAMEVRWVLSIPIKEVFDPKPPYFVRHWPTQRMARTTYKGEHFYHEALQQVKLWIKHEGYTPSDFIMREYLDWQSAPENRKIQLWVGV